MLPGHPSPARRRASFALPRGLAWFWTCVMLLCSFALPASAADYTQGVVVANSSATIWFKSSVNTTSVDVHYQVNGGGQLNVRMGYSSANARHEHTLPVASGN